MDESLFPQKPYASLLDLFGFAALTAAAWLTSFTYLSPLFISLILSSWLRSKFFAVFFRIVDVPSRWPKVMKLRKFLFERIRKECPSSGRNKGLKILEIGVGYGANFRYYKTNDEVTLLDRNPHFEAAMEAELHKYPDTHVQKFVIGSAEDMTDIGDDEYDVVFFTYLLCSVSDRTKVMKEVKRVLKKGGRLAFVEHVGYPKDHLAYWIQISLSPLWIVYCNGCRVDHSWKKELQNVFSDISYEVFYPVFMPLVLRPHVVGLATK